MTSEHPDEWEQRGWGSEEDAYAPPGAYGSQPGSPRPPSGLEAAITSLNDPLTDPLPGQAAPGEPGGPSGPGELRDPWPRAAEGERHLPDGPGGFDGFSGIGGAPDPQAGGWGQPPDPLGPGQADSPLADPLPDPLTDPLGEPPVAPYDYPSAGYDPPAAYPAEADVPTQALTELSPDTTAPEASRASQVSQVPGDPAEPDPPGTDADPAEGADPETVGLRRPDPAEVTSPPTGGRAARRKAAAAAKGGRLPATTSPAAEGGRAARRRAAARSGPSGARARTRPPVPEPPPDAGRAARRKAAKAAAKAARQTGTAISNVIGELFITTGVLMLLFVVYQLWWTNYQAQARANQEREELQERWESDGGGQGGGDPGVFSPGEGFAVLYMPTLDVVVPIAETTGDNVLDNGMVGHYSKEDKLPTAMPWDKEGNFGLAGHRNTHGEPFRYINELDPGDPIVVETADAFYTYEMASRLDSTSPSNTDVLDPIPPGSGFTEPGRYITLTTCTPEFTSTYRLIVWGEMVEERPRSEGMPDALVS